MTLDRDTNKIISIFVDYISIEMEKNNILLVTHMYILNTILDIFLKKYKNERIGFKEFYPPGCVTEIIINDNKLQINRK